jgi:uncharacterized membrane protein YbhN (UPF0104 family)
VIRRLAGSLVTRLVITTGILAWMAAHGIDAGAPALTLAVHVAAVVGVLALVAIDRLVMISGGGCCCCGARASIAFGDAAQIFLESSFVGSFLPAGVGGDAARAWSLSRGHARGSVALASVAVDRLLGVVALALLGALGVALWAQRIDTSLREWVWGVAALGLAGSAALLWIDRIARPLFHLVPVSAGLRVKLERLTGAMAQYRAEPGLLSRVLLLSLLVQGLRILQAWTLGLGLGIAVPPPTTSSSCRWASSCCCCRSRSAAGAAGRHRLAAAPRRR